MTTAETENRINATLWRAHYSTAILGNPRTSDFELVELDGSPLSADTDADFRQRGLECLGCIALHADGPRVALLYDCFDDKVIFDLTTRFLKLYQSKLLAKALMRFSDKGMVN